MRRKVYTMYNNKKFWIFATVCFAISSIMYILSYGILSFSAILNIILFVLCLIALCIFSKNNKNVSVLNDKKVKRKSTVKK